MKSKIQHCFNKNAYTYDAASFVQAVVAQNLSKILPNQAAQILEIGCGTGLFSEYLVKLFPAAKLLVTDIAPNMLELCKKRLNGHPNVNYLCIDAEYLALQQKYDLIVSSMSLHWFSEHRESFQRLVQHLKPQGQFIFALVGENSLPEWRNLFKEYQNFQTQNSFPNFQKLKNNLSFANLTTECLTYQYPSVYDFLFSLKKIGATATRAATLSVSQLRKILRQWPNEFKVTYEIIYGHYIHA